MNWTSRVAGLIVPAAVLLAGCDSRPPPATPPPATRPTAAEVASLRDLVQDAGARHVPALPAGHPPLGGGPLEGAPPPATAPAGGLRWVAPAAWERQPVRSPLRLDQYRLPRVAGDGEDGELAVFGPDVGGTIDANVARWRGQFSTPDGQPIPDAAFILERRVVADLEITIVDVAGRYDPGMAMAAGPPRDNYRMLAAIVATPAGPWYFKAVGPAATMTEHRPLFVELLDSLAFEPDR